MQFQILCDHIQAKQLYVMVLNFTGAINILRSDLIRFGSNQVQTDRMAGILNLNFKLYFKILIKIKNSESIKD